MPALCNIARQQTGQTLSKLFGFSTRALPGGIDVRSYNPHAPVSTQGGVMRRLG